MDWLTAIGRVFPFWIEHPVRGAAAVAAIILAAYSLWPLIIRGDSGSGTPPAGSVTIINPTFNAPSQIGGPSNVKFALVSSDGTVTFRRNFDEYGLTVEKREGSGEDDVPSPEYHLRFEHEPDDFEVTTRGGAVAQVQQVGPREYRVIFIGSGFGSAIEAVDFRIEAR